jgi:hypothetical protein
VHVHQCPYCELCFSFRSELDEHVALDHARHSQTAPR